VVGRVNGKGMIANIQPCDQKLQAPGPVVEIAVWASGGMSRL
jgi:hypothetical protein